MGKKLSELINKMREGHDVYDDVYTLVYDELKRIATFRLSQEHTNLTY